MIALISLALAAAAGPKAAPYPAAAAARKQLSRCGRADSALAALPDTAWQPTQDAVQEHKVLRQALGEAMPAAPTMIRVFASGGDLATTAFSIILVRGHNGLWRGTAAGRNQIWIQDAPPTIFPRKEWTLSAKNGRRLDTIIHDRCLYAEPANFYDRKMAPPVGALAYRLDIVTPSQRRSVSFFGGGVRGLTSEVIELSQPPE